MEGTGDNLILLGAGQLDEVDKSKEQDRGVKEVNKLVISSMVVDHSVFFEMEDLAANKVMRRDEEISL